MDWIFRECIASKFGMKSLVKSSNSEISMFIEECCILIDRFSVDIILNFKSIAFL